MAHSPRNPKLQRHIEEDLLGLGDEGVSLELLAEDHLRLCDVFSMALARLLEVLFLQVGHFAHANGLLLSILHKRLNYYSKFKSH